MGEEEEEEEEDAVSRSVNNSRPGSPQAGTADAINNVDVSQRRSASETSGTGRHKTWKRGDRDRGDDVAACAGR